MNCELCTTTGENVIWHGTRCRVILIEDDSYPGFCRVIWNDHIKEMTDLSPIERTEFMNTVFAVESAVRNTLKPDKINLASLGNMTPHLHWHVIPRFKNDPHFPNPIWSAAVRPSNSFTIPNLADQLSLAITQNFTS